MHLINQSGHNQIWHNTTVSILIIFENDLNFLKSRDVALQFYEY